MTSQVSYSTIAVMIYLKLKTLKHLRRKYKLTQVELSDYLGYSEGFIAKCEQGYSKPSLDTIVGVYVYFQILHKEMFPNEPFEETLDDLLEPYIEAEIQANLD